MIRQKGYGIIDRLYNLLFKETPTHVQPANIGLRIWHENTQKCILHRPRREDVVYNILKTFSFGLNCVF